MKEGVKVTFFLKSRNCVKPSFINIDWFCLIIFAWRLFELSVMTRDTRCEIYNGLFVLEQINKNMPKQKLDENI